MAYRDPMNQPSTERESQKELTNEPALSWSSLPSRPSNPQRSAPKNLPSSTMIHTLDTGHCHKQSRSSRKTRSYWQRQKINCQNECGMTKPLWGISLQFMQAGSNEQLEFRLKVSAVVAPTASFLVVRHSEGRRKNQQMVDDLPKSLLTTCQKGWRSSR